MTSFAKTSFDLMIKSDGEGPSSFIDDQCLGGAAAAQVLGAHLIRRRSVAAVCRLCPLQSLIKYFSD